MFKRCPVSGFVHQLSDSSELKKTQSLGKKIKVFPIFLQIRLGSWKAVKSMKVKSVPGVCSHGWESLDLSINILNDRPGKGAVNEGPLDFLKETFPPKQSCGSGKAFTCASDVTFLNVSHLVTD